MINTLVTKEVMFETMVLFKVTTIIGSLGWPFYNDECLFLLWGLKAKQVWEVAFYLNLHSKTATNLHFVAFDYY